MTRFTPPTRSEILSRIDEGLKFYGLTLVKPWNEIKDHIDKTDLLKLLDLAVFPQKHDPVARVIYMSLFNHIGIAVTREEDHNVDHN